MLNHSPSYKTGRDVTVTMKSEPIKQMDTVGHNKGSIMPERKKDFDLEIVQCYFEKTLLNDNTLVLENYLNAYHELCRFFNLMGRIFGFVGKDIESKIKAIEHHMHDDKLNYYSVQSMVEFESTNGVTHVKTPNPSGCRTLLRLHHALEFIIAFMKKIRDSDADEKTSRIAWDVYCDTLYKHHPWLTRKLSAVAVYALPSKKQVIELMCKQDYEKVMVLLENVGDVGEKVYNATQDVLKNNDLLHIP